MTEEPKEAGAAGETAKPRGNGLGRPFVRRHGPPPKPGEQDTRPEHWWIAYYVNGNEIRESAGRSASRSDAKRLLKRRIAEVANGRFHGLKPERVTFDELAALLADDYATNGRRSLDRAELSIAHLRKKFGRARAVDITRAKVAGYIAGRLKDGAAAASAQKEVAALGRMFTLAVRLGKLVVRPEFDDLLEVENTRVEAFTSDELEAVLDILAHGRPANGMDAGVKAQPDLAPPVLFAGVTGWRMKSDVLPLRWTQVDLAAGIVTRWSRGTSKARRHVVFPIDAVPELKEMLERQREATTALERQTSRVIPQVFHRRGRPIKDLRAAWDDACTGAGLPGRWQLDLRRTAARRLRSLGMSDRDIAELVGWEGTEMVTRYLGRDPAGVAERLRVKVAESQTRTRTIHGTFAAVEGIGER